MTKIKKIIVEYEDGAKIKYATLHDLITDFFGEICEDICEDCDLKFAEAMSIERI